MTAGRLRKVKPRRSPSTGLCRHSYRYGRQAFRRTLAPGCGEGIYLAVSLVKSRRRVLGRGQLSTSGSFFSVMTSHCGAISAFSSMNGFHSSGTLSS